MSTYISDVIGGRPFGDGKNGSATITTSGEQGQTRRNCSASISSKNLTLTSAGFVDDDLILIHQSRGSGYGYWELNRIVSGGGTSSLTLQNNTSYTYTNSGASLAQVINVPRYTDFTINSGVTYYCPYWDSSNGGLMAFAVQNTLTIDGALNTYNRGFWGADTSGLQGEGTGGPRNTYSYSCNGNGGGGGYPDGGETASGGGGGNYTAGQNGNTSGTGAIGGSGGYAVSNSVLTCNNIGGGGGSGASNRGDLSPYAGSRGAGIIFIWAYNVDCSSGSGNLQGVNGQTNGANARWGGAGAGGNLLIYCYEANLGTAIYTYGGTIFGSWSSGSGGHGLTLVNYYKSVTGTTYPNYVSTQDPRMRGVGGMMQIIG